MAVVPGNQMWKDGSVILIPFAKTFIIGSSPKDIALNVLPARGMVFEQDIQQFGRKPKDTIFQYVNFNGHFISSLRPSLIEIREKGSSLTKRRMSCLIPLILSCIFSSLWIISQNIRYSSQNKSMAISKIFSILYPKNHYFA